MKPSKPLFALLLFVFCLAAQAEVRLPRIFSDNLVLQRDVPIPVWGWAKPNEKIEVRFNGQTRATASDVNGRWSLRLAPEKAGGPYELTVAGANTVRVANVLVGEVWLCSGQSNMEWTVGQSLNAAAELAAADNPYIREIKIGHDTSGTPRDDFREGVWRPSSPVNTRDFSGVGYFFARKIYGELKVPVGIINSSWGGTNVETWTSREGFESSPEFREMIGRVSKLDLDTLRRASVEATFKRIEKLQGFKPSEFDARRFQNPASDDAGWPSMNVPGQWEGQPPGNFDGVVWFRKTITLTAAESRAPAVIELAKIDDNDVTWINGTEIGRTNQWDAPRKYTVPPGVLKEGRNLIVVKVTDTGGGGGFYGDPSDVKLTLGNSAMPLAGEWKFQVESVRPPSGENDFPSLLYNAMIAPLVPYAFRGVLWYQGESNADRAFQYRTAFPLLIADWRKKWGAGDFPFYFVQLATYTTPGDSNTGSPWAELREAQALTLKTPNTGMVVTTDIGNPKDIHPTNKQEVGRRLGALALNRVYGIKTVDGGPMFKALKIDGRRAILSFDDPGTGLATNAADGIIRGFETAGADGVFHEATGRIEGGTVVVESPEVAAPAAVRFGWAGDASRCNLFNKEGFPAVPFRTDDRQTVTRGAKFRPAGF
ncbi:MAG: beta galactosidase jelly roll domain-containing protein [Acidobacteria bacterium]|nr:beta galactosidase jelly roll domain-containing protein [Acidobacteriota bacterium]